jgi:hypothetical protein
MYFLLCSAVSQDLGHFPEGLLSFISSSLEMLKANKPDNVFLEAAPCFRSNALLLCAYGNPTIFAHAVENGGVGRKLYLSETPSIGWEAKTLGAKRRISSSEIATVPGTLDLVELLFSAVLMLVDFG